MKRKLLTLLLSPMAISLIGCNNNQQTKDLGPVNVILISGQSNAVGCTRSNYIKSSMGVPEYNRFEAGFNNVLISYDCWTKDVYATNDADKFYSQNKSKGFVPVKLGQGNGEDTFGPEIGIADYLTDEEGTNWGDKVFLIKYACGASNLKDDWAQRDSPMYGRFIKYVKSAMKKLSGKGYKPIIKAFCWMQGEGDAWGPEYYNYYKANLSTFVGNVRQDLLKLSGNTEMAFIDAKINGYGQWSAYGDGWAKVNIAKREFSQESDNNFLIDTILEGMTSLNEPTGAADKDHYDSDSEVKLGRLFAQAFEPFLE